MPLVYRLINSKYLSTPLQSGSGKRGERWNPKGVYVLYTSASPELALVEILANIMPVEWDNLPVYNLVTIKIPDSEAIKVYNVSDLPPDWNEKDRKKILHLQHFFGEWLDGTKELAVAVPSAVVPFSFNYVIHPDHPAFKLVEVIRTEPFTVDNRLIVPDNYVSLRAPHSPTV